METDITGQLQITVTKHGFEIESLEANPYYVTFIVKEKKENKKNFIELYNELEQKGLVPIMRRRKDNKIALSIASLRRPPRRNDAKIMLVLFIATLITVSIDFLQRYQGIVLLEKMLGKESSFMIDFSEYILAFILIFGLHEIGHKIMATLYGIPTRGPFFIPGIPGLIPTFGAVILQEGIPRNRDELFDIGFSGPFFGYLSTLAVAIFAIRDAIPISISELSSKFPRGEFMRMQPIVDILAQIIRPVGENMTLIINPLPLGFPVWLAFLVTFINLFPAAQLDGGHIARAIFGERGHKVLTIISLLLYILSGFWMMAIFVLLTWRLEGHPGPLDDVSETSLATKIKAAIALFMFLTSITIFLPF